MSASSAPPSPHSGRLMVDFQPDVNAFAITQQRREHNNANDKYVFTTSFGHRFGPDFVKNNNLGVQTSVLGSRVRGEDTESIQGLREDGIRQNVIQQTVGFEVKYTADT